MNSRLDKSQLYVVPLFFPLIYRGDPAFQTLLDSGLHVYLPHYISCTSFTATEDLREKTGTFPLPWEWLRGCFCELVQKQKSLMEVWAHTK